MVPTMTPAQALETLGSLRAPRERLTARAAGIVWMIWGLALTLLAFQAVFAEFPAATGATAHAGSWLLELVGTALGLTVAGFLTNAVWRAHALEAERPHAPWIPYAAGAAVVLAVSGLVVTSNWMAGEFGWRAAQGGLLFAPIALVASAGAAAIAWLQRGRVSSRPGYVAAALLLAAFALARFGPWPATAPLQFWGAAGLAWLPALAFTGVAAWTARKA